MNIRLNPYNALPIYDSIERQNRFLHSCGHHQEGIDAHRKFLLPWQVVLDSAPSDLDLAWTLLPVNPSGTSYVLPALKITTTCLDDGRTILSYDGSGIETVPDCGLYYLTIRILPTTAIGCRILYSEVMHVKDLCGYDFPGLQLSGCVDNGPDADFTIASDDTLSQSLLDESIQQLIDNIWTHIDDSFKVVNITPLDETPVYFRRVIQTACGFFKKDYVLTYEAADVCGTAALTEV